MAHRVLFLTLKTFSFTGGIEKVCRTICRTLYDIGEEAAAEPMVYSMYDENYDRDSRYLKKQQYQGFKGNRKIFVLKAFFKGITADAVILSHVHLLSIGYFIKRFSPGTKVYLIAHGIEIWKKFPEPKLKALRRLDKIICVSEFTAEKIKNIHGIDQKKLEVLNNCLDPFYYFHKEFTKPKDLLKRYGLTEDHTILMSLCRLSSSEKYKGYDNTLAILPQLVKKYPKLQYLLAGKYDEEEKIRIDKLIAKYKITDHVKLLGFVDEAEVSDHFLLSDIFLLPSKKEGFGIVFIEAMASGLSVLGGNKDGSVDALRNGDLGILVDPDNLEEIEQALANMLAHPLRHEEKIELQKKVLASFNYEDYKESIKSLILNGTTAFHQLPKHNSYD
ncbi:MAG: glycosyltransferase family 4 protein [Pedobacter sp.]|nr:glycosyltransferase family 4 protein [Pedobacter sp.]MDQ8053959.1 glycosyltransferase family 4 protein [Pedobacter sp.]